MDKTKKYHIVGTIPILIIKIVETGGNSTPHITHIHDHSLYWLDTSTSIKCGGVKLDIYDHNFPLSEMMSSCVFHIWVKCQSSHIAE